MAWRSTDGRPSSDVRHLSSGPHPPPSPCQGREPRRHPPNGLLPHLWGRLGGGKSGTRNRSILPPLPLPRPPLAGLSDSHIRDGDRRRIKRKRGNKPQRHKEHQERRTLTDALSDQKAFSESATVLKKSRPLCALGVLVVFLTAEKLTTKTRRAPRARHFLPSGAASIPVAEALFGSVERQPLGVLGVLVVHRPAGQDASGRKCVKTVALPGEGAPAAPANRTPPPFMGEVGRGQKRHSKPFHSSALAPPPALPLPGEGVWFAPASRSERRPTGGCRPDSSPSHGGGWEGAKAALETVPFFRPCPTPRPPLARLSDSHIRDGDRRRIKRKRGNKPQRHKEHQERRTLTDALSDQKAFSESATVLKKSRPLCALGVLVVFLTAEKLTTKTRRAPRARHFLPSGAASIPVAEALFGSVERRPLGVLGVLVVHRPAGQDASGRKCVKTVALPGEGAPAAPANRTPPPVMGEAGSQRSEVRSQKSEVRSADGESARFSWPWSRCLLHVFGMTVTLEDESS